MEEHYEQEFKDIAYNNTYQAALYESCTFINCSMESIKLGDSRFIDCRFEGCDLSNCNIHGTAFRNVVFMSCKMMGLRIDTCNAFGLSLEFNGCVLDYSIFADVDLRKSTLNNCTLLGVDFSGANLNKSKITNCSLNGATFNNTNLKESNLLGSTNIILDPLNNDIYKMKISQTELIGLLSDYHLLVG